MYIRRKVFSILQNEEGEEKLFSTTEFINEDYEQREFAEGEKPKKNLIANQSSNRGNVRAYLLGGEGGIIGRAAGNRAATLAAREGKSDEEVMKEGKKVAGRVGGSVGALSGAIGATVGTLAANNGSVKTLGRNTQFGLGAALKQVNKKAAEKGNKRVYKVTKTAMQKLGHANSSKVGKIALGTVATGAAIADGTLSRLGARLGAKKAISERKEKADVERYGK